MDIRKATLADIKTISQIRKQQLIDEGIEPDVSIDSQLASFFKKTIAEGSLIEYLILDGQQIIATAAIYFQQFPPTYSNQSGVKGYITNMYTADSYRGKGLATRLLHQLVNEAKKKGVTKLWLGTSKLGRPVYEKFGFKQTSEWLNMDI
ncbi:GNAT family N-acetyltransferase [Lentilactobacillus hilgardii]|uniref:Acetyltransferase, GNAT family n=1 Tax=Lentilactobacillus hilgardii (strain ATCC 8290 / DSM 20176 / CCUG 30140 / JCM 1155 / KCTC 3500 / NBRC 15886 / NCIMB 8040 / NRRL B-1843 / 9) TaxID=1423757 RepID=C0XI78_LENH9|nr:GNAT family N-acetyltransferase [Lentilactobacillus hilgardii]EEI24929.1 acetyltransferase, GNAT family [Lentilactobacillus hilgardii DSM 20176 = ATCC 8290]KRK55045.1 acetyltransferase [Lentilactobacillus hilgardii DSM 20176 = ATCC 8290]QEU39616.1 GNAT family N-acetyltransferase [Lentilactobacillus hilgardii]TDG80559.1 hypothetical protein C5L34_001043 [Lentilactobacillus hilgardii]